MTKKLDFSSKFFTEYTVRLVLVEFSEKLQLSLFPLLKDVTIFQIFLRKSHIYQVSLAGIFPGNVRDFSSDLVQQSAQFWTKIASVHFCKKLYRSSQFSNLGTGLHSFVQETTF